MDRYLTQVFQLMDIHMLKDPVRKWWVMAGLALHLGPESSGWPFFDHRAQEASDGHELWINQKEREQKFHMKRMNRHVL